MVKLRLNHQLAAKLTVKSDPDSTVVVGDLDTLTDLAVNAAKEHQNV